MPMQFVRVVTGVDEMELWNANRNGFSFVISFESHSGPGLRGRAGFVASWRPIYQNRCAIKVGGSPDLAPKFYPALSSPLPLDLPCWAVGATGAGAEPSA